MYTGGCDNITKIRIKFYTHEIKNKTFSSIKQTFFIISMQYHLKEKLNNYKIAII